MKIYIVKKILLILILTLSFQSLVKSDDIKDFEIEGMSIGDSLLKFYSKNKIENNLRNFYNDDTYLISVLPTLEDNTMYEYLQVHFKKNDKNYIVEGIDGLIDIDIKECLKMQEDVKDEISTIFKNISVSGPNVYSHAADPSDRSTTTHYEWSLKNSIIEVVCYDFVEPVTYPDGLNVAMQTINLQNWLNAKAY